MKTLLLLGMLTLGAYVAPVNGAAIINGGFETGDFTGWTTHTCVGSCFAQGWSVTTANPASGSYAAQTLCVFASCLDPANGDWIGQTPTGVVAGTNYQISLGINPVQPACAACEIDVYWGGALVGQFANLPGGYATYSVNVVGGAGNTLDFLEITGRHDPNTIYVDNVTIAGGASTNSPEPVTSMLVGCGLAACGWYRRKRKV